MTLIEWFKELWNINHQPKPKPKPEPEPTTYPMKAFCRTCSWEKIIDFSIGTPPGVERDYMCPRCGTNELPLFVKPFDFEL